MLGFSLSQASISIPLFFIDQVNLTLLQCLLPLACRLLPQPLTLAASRLLAASVHEFGEIQSLEMLRSRFQTLPAAFNERLIPPIKPEETQRKGLRDSISHKFAEIAPDKKEAAKFSQMWNNIITSFREEEIIMCGRNCHKDEIFKEKIQSFLLLSTINTMWFEIVNKSCIHSLASSSKCDFEFVLKVGDTNKDHACWERPEDMDTPRTVLKIDSSNPGSDVAAETAAALASASLVFRNSDRSYSRILLNRAISVFDFADKHRGAYSNGLKPFVCPFYCSYSGYEDELLWGAAWLHKATKNPRYLDYIQSNGQTLGVDESDNTFGWDNKHVGARILLSKEFLVQNVKSLHDYEGHADNFICSLIPRAAFSSTQYTPAY